MSTAFSWSARLTDAAGEPAAGAVLDVQIFDLKTNAWIAASSAKTNADGVAKGSGQIEDDTLPYAPAFRLMEGPALMSVGPQFGRAARGGGLVVEFGQVRRLALTENVVVPNLAGRVLRTGVAVGGVAATDAAVSREVDVAAVRNQAVAETTQTFNIRLAARDKDVADRDAQLVQQSALLAARDGEIAALRKAQVDPAAIRAQAVEETSRSFTARLAQRDQELTARDAQLADRNRLVLQHETELSRLRKVVTDQERLIDEIKARPPPTPPPGTAARTLKTVAVNDLATTMATQLDNAQATLKPRGFSLGAIQINAKGLIRDSGSLELLDAETLKGLPADSLSDVKFQFVPDKPTPPDLGPKVPDVLQLTESAARRVLTSVGLVLEASTGPRALNTAVAPGQAMMQSPVAGAVIPRGAKVQVIFAEDQGA